MKSVLKLFDNDQCQENVHATVKLFGIKGQVDHSSMFDKFSGFCMWTQLVSSKPLKWPLLGHWLTQTWICDQMLQIFTGLRWYSLYILSIMKFQCLNTRKCKRWTIENITKASLHNIEQNRWKRCRQPACDSQHSNGSSHRAHMATW